MAKAFRCDQCGSYFDGHPVREVQRKIELAKRTDGLFFLNLDTVSSDVHKIAPPDLCERCFREIIIKEVSGSGGLGIKPNSS